MKRVEVKLSLPVVAPLLDVIKAAADRMRGNLAAPLDLQDLDPEFRDSWSEELLAGQNEDVSLLLSLFGHDFFSNGVIAFDANNAETIVRACSAVRLQLRADFLVGLDDNALESGDVQLMELDEPVRRAFMAYLFLATIQELILQHLDPSTLEG